MSSDIDFRYDIVLLRNGTNIISNIHFGNDFIAVAEDNTENKNHEIVSSLFLNEKYICPL
jgi:hypothetical protein